jgi:peroxiredoxin
MVALQTPECNSDLIAPDFSLRGTDGKTYCLKDVAGENGLLIMFICNHCPYVQAIIDKIVTQAAELQHLGVGVAAIMPNDTDRYPQDNLQNMTELANQKNFTFPYLLDHTQEVAKCYDAICTPDFFGFDRNLHLQYRGRFDDSAMEFKNESTNDLFNALSQISQIDNGPRIQHPSVGCSIKWRDHS